MKAKQKRYLAKDRFGQTWIVLAANVAEALELMAAAYLTPKEGAIQDV